MERTGADIIMECLSAQGVDTVFGYPGASALYLYDALFRHEGKIRHILTAHEQGAVHAADGYARSSGKTGVVFATSGPGATNLVTGIATAYMDSVPLVAITCNVSNDLLGKDSFQETDIVSITMPITKHNFLVRQAEDIAPTLSRAFAIANTGRKGPVLVDITTDATCAVCDAIPEKVSPPTPTVQSKSSDFTKALRFLKKAKRPLIYAGGGVISAGATEELLRFQSLSQAPVAVSAMGIGGFPTNHPAYLGMVGMHGTDAAAYAVRSCDLLIAVGARFSDRVTSIPDFAAHAAVLHLDTDLAEIGKNIRTDAYLLGDAKELLARLNLRLPQQDRKLWLQEANRNRFPIPQTLPEQLFSALYEVLGEDAYLTCDVGQHQMWAAQFYPVQKPRHFIHSGGLGTMGFGLGAAIGTQIAHPDATVVNICGDGCFHMNMNELITAATYKLPIIDIVLDNGALGMVRQWQKTLLGGRFSQTEPHRKTDYKKVAEGLGANACTASTPEELTAAVCAALSHRDKPSVIHVTISADEAAFPLIAEDSGKE